MAASIWKLKSGGSELLTKKRGSGLLLCFPRRAPSATEVFDWYWRFAAERQAIFFRRLSGAEPPWTEDAILSTFRFTNVYRASDRVSQYLIQNVIYDEPHSLEDLFFRIIVFKLFNKIETWELLDSQAGPIRYSKYRFDKYDEALTTAMRNKTRIYSSAYIMPSGGPNYLRKHRAHLWLLETMMRDKLPQKLADCPSMKDAFALLLGYPMIGEFLAYQFVTDLNYSEVTNFSEMEFVAPGPGARSGIHKCFSDLCEWPEEEIIRWVAENQEAQFAERKLEFRSLRGRPLQLIDCQNLFCEIDKYARVRFPGISGHLQRTRIKRKFESNPAPIAYWYPPKWGINADIDKGTGLVSAASV